MNAGRRKCRWRRIGKRLTPGSVKYRLMGRANLRGKNGKNAKTLLREDRIFWRFCAHFRPMRNSVASPAADTIITCLLAAQNSLQILHGIGRMHPAECDGVFLACVY